jgi:hypothetical protein
MQLDDTLRAFLHQRLIARITTIAPEGYPHTVPIWYMLDGNDILLTTGYNARKLDHIRANPKGSVVIGGDPVSDEHKAYQTCYLFQGEFSLEGEPGYDLIRKMAYRYMDDHDEAERDIALWGPHQDIRFTIRKILKVM